MPPARLDWICPVAAYLCLTDGTGIGQRRPSIEDAACVGLGSHGPRPLGTAQPKGSESSALHERNRSGRVPLLWTRIFRPKALPKRVYLRSPFVGGVSASGQERPALPELGPPSSTAHARVSVCLPELKGFTGSVQLGFLKLSMDGHHLKLQTLL